MKLWKKIILGIVLFLFVLLGIMLYLSQFHLDFSQNYRKVEGYENIVFKDPRSKQYFRLCAWGLVKAESPDEFEDHSVLDTSSYEYQLIVESTDAGKIQQVVSSPDGRYILYVEIINVGSGYTTDEEKVYYRVYSIDDGTSITIYSGYRQYLLVDWK
ncbi:MAG: hypothetical protein J5379_04515 [Clostridiales bacterium]|nr:hypothetical protein [Clostridiales bacterium]